MRIYTKTGDDGSTGLYGGDRTLKTSKRVAALGEVDELNATVGVARIFAKDSELDLDLSRIQNWLFDLGAEVGCVPGGKFQVISVTEAEIGYLEQSIDIHTESLPPLKAFILPGGSPLAAHLHLARVVCRRVERTVCDLHAEFPVRGEAIRFLNRLSDWFFTAARAANRSEGVVDVEWTKATISPSIGTA